MFILKPKKWFRILFYVSAVFFIAASFLNLYSLLIHNEMMNTPLVFELFLIMASALVLLFFGITLFTFHHFRIEVDENEIRKFGIGKKNISYQEISKVIVQQGRLEILGTSFFHRISIGNLYTDFDKAYSFLGQKLKSIEGIDFKGSSKHLENFLGV